MAQTPEGTAAPVQDLDRVPRPVSKPRLPLAAGYVFHPKASSLFEGYLIPRARGGVIKHHFLGSVEDGVDVYGLRPEALPFPYRDRGMVGRCWGYFFTSRSAGGIGGAEGGGDDEVDDVREVAAGGCWRRYGGGDKEYVDRRDGEVEVYAFRRRFAFHKAGNPGKKTVWRMKEYWLKETAPRFRGVVFDPNAKGVVIWKVYNDLIPKEEPPVDYYGIGMNDVDDDDEEEEEIGPVVITVGDAAAPAP